MPSENNTFTLNVRRLSDGGLVLRFPDDLCQLLDWSSGDELSLTLSQTPERAADPAPAAAAEAGSTADAGAQAANSAHAALHPFMEDCSPDGWPPVRMRDLHLLCLELDRQERLFGAAYAEARTACS